MVSEHPCEILQDLGHARSRQPPALVCAKLTLTAADSPARLVRNLLSCAICVFVIVFSSESETLGRAAAHLSQANLLGTGSTLPLSAAGR